MTKRVKPMTEKADDKLSTFVNACLAGRDEKMVLTFTRDGKAKLREGIDFDALLNPLDAATEAAMRARLARFHR